jgi:chromosome segregation ATPase
MSTVESSPNESSPNDLSFAEMLQNLDANVAKLKSRYAQVEQDQTRQVELQERQAALSDSPNLTTDQQTELEKVETELRELELRLESELFSWDSWKQYFWQTVRFVGLGVAIGWGMAFYVMKHPVPHAIEPNRPEQVR